MLPLLFLVTVLLGCDALTVQPLGFLKLNDSRTHDVTGRPVFGNGAATASAYDSTTGFLYVIGTVGDVLNIVDVNDPSQPRHVRKRTFDDLKEGLPDSIAICHAGSRHYLAISFEAVETESHAFLKIFKPVQSPVDDLEILYDRVNLDGYDPTSMAWAQDCSALVVVQQGRVHKIHHVFDDPRPYIDIVLPRITGTSRVPVPISESALAAAGVRHVLTECENDNTLTSTAVQDLEPRSVVVDSNNVAFITFPKNNAIAGLNLNSGADQYQLQFMNVGTKEWASKAIDCSDDNTINPENYPIHTFYQPVGVATFTHHGETHLATSDMGDYMSYPAVRPGITSGRVKGPADPILSGPEDGCQFEESYTGLQWINTEFFAKMRPEDQEILRNAMNDVSKLGQMRFTKLKQRSDYYDAGLQGYTQVTGYGGRGMSILKPGNKTREYDSGDLFERVFTDSSFPANYKSIFNADIGSASSYPSSRKDKTSPTTGPTPRAIVAGEIGNTLVLVVANSQVGGFYYFTVDRKGAMPLPTYHGFYRRGNSGLSWLDSYDVKDDSVGEPETKHIEWIDRNSNREAVIAVLGNRAGVVSLYRLTL